MSSVAPINSVSSDNSVSSNSKPIVTRWADEEDEEYLELEKSVNTFFDKEKEVEEEKKQHKEKLLEKFSSYEKKIEDIKNEKKKLDELEKITLKKMKDTIEKLEKLGHRTLSSSSSSSSSPSSWVKKVSSGNSFVQTNSRSTPSPKSEEPSKWKIYGFDHKVLTEFTLTKESFDFHLNQKKTISPGATVICTFMCKGKCTRSDCGFLHPSHCENKCNDLECPFFHEHRENRTSWIKSYNEFFENKFYNLFE